MLEKKSAVAVTTLIKSSNLVLHSTTAWSHWGVVLSNLRTIAVTAVGDGDRVCEAVVSAAAAAVSATFTTCCKSVIASSVLVLLLLFLW